MHALFVASNGTGRDFGLQCFRHGKRGWSGTQIDSVDCLSALAIHPVRPVLYGVAGDQTTGVLHWWDLSDSARHASRRIPSGGLEPSHVTVDESGRVLVVTNYSSGTLGIWYLDPDGKPGMCNEIVQLDGSSINPERQAMSHPHQARLIAGRMLITDLGADLIREFSVPAVPSGSVREIRAIATPPGTGPRHMAALPGDRLAISGELASTALVVDLLEHRPAGSDPAAIREGLSVTSSTLRQASAVQNYPGDIESSASGRFVYITNRGANTVSTIRVHGNLPLIVDERPTDAAWPQHITLSGNDLLVACRDASAVVAFRLKHEVPSERRVLFECPSPAWLTIVPTHLYPYVFST